MTKIDSIINNKIAQNIFIWVILFIVLTITVTGSNKSLLAFYSLLFLIPPVYINNLLILPFFKHSSIYFTFLFLINLLFFSTFSVYTIQFFGGKKMTFESYLSFFGILLLTVIFSSVLKFSRDSFMRRQQEKEAELKLLKAQLNPHFLFNTLNNLYGLSVVKSDRLPSLMLKLSDLLRYSLYETKEKLVPLSKEIAYLKNYISLEKIRLENIEINFTTNGEVNNKSIAPMLFIVFVENAFKHLSTEKSKVTITILVNEDELHFTCKNTTDNKKPLEENLEKGKSGIGLTNAKKRLALMYPEKHKLKIKNESTFFSVDLIIKV